MTTDPQTTRYRHRPDECDAVQWTDTNAAELEAFAGSRFMTIDPEDRTDDPDATAAIRSSKHESWALLRPGDWVIRRGDSFALLPDDEFTDLYEPVAAAAPADRAAIAARLWQIAEHTIIAEWICCDPINPTHDLCVKGGAALEMTKSLLVDDPEAWKPAPLLDAVMALGAPPAVRPELRDQIAEALIAWTYRGKGPEHGGILETVRANAYSRADAVLAVLLGPIPADTNVATWTAVRAIQLMNEAGQQRDAAVSATTNRAAVLREEAAKIRAHCPDHLDSESAEGSWMACHCDVADDMERRMAVEAQQQTETEAHPAEHTWAAELHDPLADEWVPGTRYPVRERAVNALEHAKTIGPTWKDGAPTQRRLVRMTTTYTVEQPAVVAAATGEEPAGVPHSCANCEGIDPDTCWMNPNRPPEQCPAAEFEDYGSQCEKPAGHNLHSFEEPTPTAVSQPGKEN